MLDMTFVLVIMAMIFARSAAMAFNRFLDRDIDVLNPRTISREIPAGIISPKSALILVIVSGLLFIGTTYFINPICFYLSPVALLVILGYTYTKRFTFLCHIVLGLGLGLAPVGAFLAVTGFFELEIVLLGFAVLFWVAGFDIIYALQDDQFDRQHKLQSIPARLGRKNALWVSRGFHFISGLMLIFSCYMIYNSVNQMGMLLLIGVAVFVSGMIYQHTLVKYNDLSRVDMAFFTTNGLISAAFGVLLIIDLFV